MQTDPIGYDDNMNMYAYANNDPINNMDPTGMTCTDASDGGCQEPPPPCECSSSPSDSNSNSDSDSNSNSDSDSGDDLPTVDEDVAEMPDDQLPEVDSPKESGPKEKDVPNASKPNDVVEGRRRTREYDESGKPKRDYDKPHQGEKTDHVHEWPNGKREHPGREYSPWPRR